VASGVQAAAARWYAGHEAPELAVEHAFLAGDPELAAELIAAAAMPPLLAGRGATVDRWLAAFDGVGLAAQPDLAVVAAAVHLLQGRADEALAAADIAERAAGRSDGPAGLDQLEAILCRRGPREALAAAARAVAASEAGPSRVEALVVEACLRALAGEAEAAEGSLAAALDALPAPSVSVAVGWAKRAALRIRAGDWDGAERAMARSRELATRVPVDALLPGLLVFAVDARVAVQHGDLARARENLVHAQQLRPLASEAAPWLSVDALLEMARAYLAISDPAGAQLVLREAEHIVRHRPALGRLTDELIELRRRLAGAASVLAGSSTLTSAELRLLPLLPTYLSFQEIADRMRISRNTVKTHAMSIYGKLWASSRGEAVERAVELGLLEPFPALGPDRQPASSSVSRDLAERA
jgi:LuxR family maltose regulon positive regulatory protein